MSTDLVANEDSRGALQLMLDLETAGALDAVSLTLTDPDMPYQRWEDLGRYLGNMDKRIRWYIGDWLNFGEGVYGHEAAQAIEATTKDRYSEIERVTGLDHQTILNIQSLCRRVTKSHRRRELGFWTHAPVAPLEPDEQDIWLERAIEFGWTRAELAQAIKDEKNPSTGDDDDDDQANGAGPVEGVSRAEQVEIAARQVYRQASTNSDGDYVVPPPPMTQLGAALGEH